MYFDILFLDLNLSVTQENIHSKLLKMHVWCFLETYVGQNNMP